jgi:magnesium chelatase family protein
MHCCWRGASLRGIEGMAVRVEVQMARGLPGLSLVGQAGSATRESRERVFSALRESGYFLPRGRVTVNLAPAEEPKEGTAFDLAMALGLLEVSGQLHPRRGRDWTFLGELGLDGRLLPLRGALPLGLAALADGAAGILLPVGNAEEVRHLEGLPIRLVNSLAESVAWLQGEEVGLRPEPSPPGERRELGESLRLPGGPLLRRALAAAAAGRHNVLLIGGPGNGKTTLAHALSQLLPSLSRVERREVIALRSVSGLPTTGSSRPPFRAPHHSLSVAGLLGGTGSSWRPGELSLANRGLLFLDELPEFRREVLEAMREPLEEGRLVLARAGGRHSWATRFQLVAAMNPCPCGQSLQGEEYCRCTPPALKRYRGRISGALLDRIDMILELPSWSGTASEAEALAPAEARRLAAQVLRARRRLDRAQVASLSAEDARWLDTRLHEAGASLRQRVRAREISRSLAALDGRPVPRREDVLEALDLGLRWRWAFTGMTPPRG